MNTGFRPWLLLLLLLASSCATQKLFDDTNPRERIWISAKDVPESELIRKKVHYTKYSDAYCNGYLVEKSKMRKFGDLMIRATGAPVTLVVDAATTISVVGVAVFAAAAETDPQGTADAVNGLIDHLLGQH